MPITTATKRTAKRSNGKGPLMQPPAFLPYCPAPDATDHGGAFRTRSGIPPKPLL